MSPMKILITSNTSLATCVRSRRSARKAAVGTPPSYLTTAATRRCAEKTDCYDENINSVSCHRMSALKSDLTIVTVIISRTLAITNDD